MTAQQPNTPDVATVDSAAARQTCDWQASLDQPENHTPERAQPEHGEAQSCAPRQPFHHVEILVDGKRIHSILASDIRTREDRECITLEASRWYPSVTIPPNPAFPDTRREINLSVDIGGKLYPFTGDNPIFGNRRRPAVAEPEPDPLRRALAVMSDLVGLAETLANTGRGSCPDCQSGAHKCAEDACYCTDPHRCGWPNITTTEGTN